MWIPISCLITSQVNNNILKVLKYIIFRCWALKTVVRRGSELRPFWLVVGFSVGQAGSVASETKTDPGAAVTSLLDPACLTHHDETTLLPFPPTVTQPASVHASRTESPLCLFVNITRWLMSLCIYLPICTSAANHLCLWVTNSHTDTTEVSQMSPAMWWELNKSRRAPLFLTALFSFCSIRFDLWMKPNMPHVLNALTVMRWPKKGTEGRRAACAQVCCSELPPRPSRCSNRAACVPTDCENVLHISLHYHNASASMHTAIL